MGEEFTIECLCLFCGAPLEHDEEVEIEAGDLIKCISCGEENDCDSVVEVAKEIGMEKVKAELDKKIADTMKGLFK